MLRSRTDHEEHRSLSRWELCVEVLGNRKLDVLLCQAVRCKRFGGVAVHIARELVEQDNLRLTVAASATKHVAEKCGDQHRWTHHSQRLTWRGKQVLKLATSSRIHHVLKRVSN